MKREGVPIWHTLFFFFKINVVICTFQNNNVFLQLKNNEIIVHAFL